MNSRMIEVGGMAAISARLWLRRATIIPDRSSPRPYTLNDFYSSDLTTKDGPTTQVFYALIFFDGDMEEGYTMRFHYGGRSKEGWGASWESVETFDGGCVQSAIRRPDADAGELEGVRPLVHQAERSHPDAKRAVQLHGSLLSG